MITDLLEEYGHCFYRTKEEMTACFCSERSAYDEKEKEWSFMSRYRNSGKSSFMNKNYEHCIKHCVVYLCIVCICNRLIVNVKLNTIKTMVCKNLDLVYDAQMCLQLCDLLHSQNLQDIGDRLIAV